LPAAVGLNRMNDVKRMAPSAKPGELLIALTVAAFYGKTDMIAYLLSIGADPNSSPENGEGFHSHATPLHQAVSSGSIAAVKLLVEAGAKLDARDKIYDGTPFDWAEYMQREEGVDETARKSYFVIEAYLREKEQAG
jgi:ankyrin repeat protein